MKNALISKCYKKRYLLFFFFTAIILINILTVGTILNLMVTLPQIIIIFLLIIKNNLKAAALLHFCFISLSLSAQGIAGMFEGNQDILLLNYGTIKLVGPVRVCYFINAIFVLACLSSHRKPRKDILFYKLFKTFLYIGIPATVIGLLGLMFHSNYSYSGFVGPFVYIFVVVSSCYILACLATDDFIMTSYYLSIICIISGIIGSYLAFLMGVVTNYSVFEVIYTADIVYFGALLLPGIIFIKEKFPLYLGLILFSLISIVALSGKGVFCLVFEAMCLFYYMFICKDIIKEHHSQIVRLRPVVIILIFLFFTYGVSKVGAMSVYKFQSALSMFSLDINDIAGSPYVRIASLMNIINDGLNSPFNLIFGNGYGGYFEDNLNMFAGLDLAQGAWQEDVVKTGRFTSGHDTMVSVPLFNGILGVMLIIRIVILYLKRLTYNYLYGVAFLWILLMFYFNTIFSFIGVFLLLGAEYDLRNNDDRLLKRCNNIKCYR